MSSFLIFLAGIGVACVAAAIWVLFRVGKGGRDGRS